MRKVLPMASAAFLAAAVAFASFANAKKGRDDLLEAAETSSSNSGTSQVDDRSRHGTDSGGRAGESEEGGHRSDNRGSGELARDTAALDEKLGRLPIPQGYGSGRDPKDRF